MKKYLLFAGSQCYPDGGWNDYIGTFDTIKDCFEKIIDDSKTFSDYWQTNGKITEKSMLELRSQWNQYCWLHIVDVETLKIVLKSGPEYPGSDDKIDHNLFIEHLGRDTILP